MAISGGVLFPTISTITQRVVCLGNESAAFNISITFTTTHANQYQVVIPLAIGIGAIIVGLLIFKFKLKR